MKHIFLSLIFLLQAVVLAFSQDQPPQQQQAQSQQQTPQQQAPKNHIRGGFYLKLGASIPMGEFTNRQVDRYLYQGMIDTITFNSAKLGAAFELGYLIYIGPAFAGNHIRAGIDATFLAISFNPTDQALPASAKSSKKMEYWYYFAGQKFGPLITINPVDYLMIDLSYKINAVAAWYNSRWGRNLAMNEVSLGIRYKVILFAFQYNWGKIKYTYNQDDNPRYMIDNSTMRILIGFKF